MNQDNAAESTVTNFTQSEPVGKVNDSWKRDDPTLPKLTEEERKDAWQQAMDYVRSQEPLNRVYETSDFAQGIARGRKIEHIMILNLLREEIKRVSEPMMVDKEYLDGVNAAIHIVQKSSNK